MSNYSENKSAARPGLRAFIKARRARVQGFGLLLFYCHMLMLFAFLLRQVLPGGAEWTELAGLTGLPELAGVALLGQISAIMIWVMFGLTTLSLLWPVCFKVGLGLGLAHALAALVLLARAAWGLAELPEASLAGLPEQARVFAAGGYWYWLAGVAGLLAILVLTGRAAKIRYCPHEGARAF